MVLFKGKEKNITISDTEQIENNFSRKKVAVPLGGQIIFYDMDFINALIEKKFQRTGLFNRLNNIILNFNKES